MMFFAYHRETPSYKYYLIMIKHSFSPKMSRKRNLKIGLQITSERPKIFLNSDFCMEKLLASEVTIFPDISFKF